MNMLKYLSIVFFIVITCKDLYLIKTSQEKKRYWTKPLIIPGIMMIYLFFSHHLNTFLLCALTFSFFGDLFLLFSEKKRYFFLGLFAFLTSHILYICIFLENSSFLKESPLKLFSLAIPYIIYAYFFLRKLYTYLRNTLFPVLCYMTSIMAMSYFSLLRFLSFISLAALFPLIGSLLFVISDSLLAIRNFRYGLKKGWVMIMATYILGQLLIMIGFLN